MNSRQRRKAARSHALYFEVREALGRRPVLEDFKLIEAVTRKLQGLDDPYQVKSQKWEMYGSDGSLRATFESSLPFFLPKGQPITATIPYPSLRILNLTPSIPSDLCNSLSVFYPAGGFLPNGQ